MPGRRRPPARSARPPPATKLSSRSHIYVSFFSQSQCSPKLEQGPYERGNEIRNPRRRPPLPLEAMRSSPIDGDGATFSHRRCRRLRVRAPPIIDCYAPRQRSFLVSRVAAAAPASWLPSSCRSIRPEDVSLVHRTRSNLLRKNRVRYIISGRRGWLHPGPNRFILLSDE